MTTTQWGKNFHQIACNSCKKLWNLMGEQAIAPLAQPLPTPLNEPQYFQCNFKKRGPIMLQGCFNYILWSSVRPLVATTGACRSIILPCDRDRRKRFGRGGGQISLPYSNQGVHYPHHINTRPFPPDFQTFLRPFWLRLDMKFNIRVRLPTSLAKREDICHFAEVRSHMLFCLPMNRELNYYILLM